MSPVIFALGITTLAGLATGVGSAIAFFAKRTNYRFLSISTGFSAGVMLYVSFIEIFYKGQEAFVDAYGNYWGHWGNVVSFFGGMLFIGIIDNFVPEAENPHTVFPEKVTAPLHDESIPIEYGSLPPVGEEQSNLPRATDFKEDDHGKLLRMGLFTALAIGIHNFPEGLATFLAALQDPGVGIAIAVAIALHNIPEGISVSVPIYYATGSRSKAFIYSCLSGLAEPIGALVAYGLIVFLIGPQEVIPPAVMGIMFAGVAGIMVYISIDELIPTSQAYGRGHDSILGLIGGMAVMALSLLLMK
ncbi:MAG: zinc transporter ZupT [Thermovirgaceae bacterium]